MRLGVFIGRDGLAARFGAAPVEARVRDFFGADIRYPSLRIAAS
jgi:hypothetical protein